VSRILDLLSHKRQGQKTVVVTELETMEISPTSGNLTYFETNKLWNPPGKFRRQKPRSWRRDDQKEKRQPPSRADGEGEAKRPRRKPTLIKGIQPCGKRRAPSPGNGPAKKSVAVQVDEGHHAPMVMDQELEASMVQVVNQETQTATIAVAGQHDQSVEPSTPKE
jgi:hypothetical protein